MSKMRSCPTRCDDYGSRHAPAAREGAGMSSLDASQTNVETSNAAEREVHVLGELVYEYTLLVTRVVEYGASANTLLSGQASPAPEGARIDFYLEGSVIGPKLTGTVKGVDYLYFRADGRAQLHIHAEITTEDGKKIALAADGIAIPAQGSPVFQLRANVTLLTNPPDLAMVDAIHVCATGTVDVSNGQVRVKAYAA